MLLQKKKENANATYTPPGTHYVRASFVTLKMKIGLINPKYLIKQ